MQCPAPGLLPAAPPVLPCPCRHRQQVSTTLKVLWLPQHYFAIFLWKATLQTYCRFADVVAWICIHDLGFKVTSPVYQHRRDCRHSTCLYASREADCSLC